MGTFYKMGHFLNYKIGNSYKIIRLLQNEY